MQKIHKTTESCDLSFKPYLKPTEANPHPNKGLPLILHSNGRVCWPATDYLLDRHVNHNNIAISTIGTYARHFSKVISFLDHKKIGFEKLSDDLLFELREYLWGSDDFTKEKLISANQFNSILQRLFTLLIWLKAKKGVGSHVISDDPGITANINIEKKSFTPKGAKKSRTYFDHPCKLPPENTNKRKAITDDAIDTLVETIYDFTDNSFIQSRWSCILEMLEVTGARDSELVTIKINAVAAAKKMISEGKTAKLLITTTKGSNKGKKRMIPVSADSIQLFDDYIKYERQKIINSSLEKGAIKEDQGFLFITNDGRSLSAGRLSDHFREVRNFAKLDSHEATPHMFRHRFISNQVSYRLEKLLNSQHQKGVGIESFVIKRVKLLTGHASDQSLWWYVEDVLERMEIFEDIEETISNLSEKTASLRRLQRSIAKMKKASLQ